ncbi:hypothetical protein D7319_20025 [Streptomyces radicis]|uniref:UL36 very large tegument protein n=1 Tax=Streptomyces radicis TaxID=1750517 RepID=A0A3A9W2C4_9ACTN|nr:hypothetical protein D7319_20025 [Streptomyces radicis]RKN15871.1 hypothetical protein D7318_26770 [Streptomyces radicis]
MLWAQRELVARLAAFTAELRAVTDVLDPESGWYGAFARRGAQELDAWLTGRDLAPWDAVADLLQDLAGARGTAAAEEAGRRLRSGYEAAASAQDALPTSREALSRRLADLDRAERGLRDRLRQLGAGQEAARRAGMQEEADRLATLLLWAQDDEERALSRRSELRGRLAALRAREREPVDGPGDAPERGPERAEERAPEREPERKAAREPERKAAPAQRKRPRGARFAGLDDEAVPSAVPSTVPVTEPPAESEPAVTPPPTGSRFAGALGEAARRPRLQPSPEDRRAAHETAERLRWLRAEGQSGAAHVTLSEAVTGPPVRVPVLMAELEHTGMTSDLSLLLWEAASLPPFPLAAVADALAEAGRERDCGQLLRQSAARPAPEAGTIAAELSSAGHAKEAVELLAAIVQARSAGEAARAATGAPSPHLVVPLLLDAAYQVSPGHYYAVTSELRRAGVA